MIKPFALRINEDVLNKLRELAREDGRSLNNYICEVLKKHLDNINNK